MYHIPTITSFSELIKSVSRSYYFEKLSVAHLTDEFPAAM